MLGVFIPPVIFKHILVTDSLNVVLGCFGRSSDGFVSCRSCENIILVVSPKIQHFYSILEYFESCRLPDKPMMDTQAIRHFLYNMQNDYQQFGKKLWNENKYIMYQTFLEEHKKCGLFLRLDVANQGIKYNNRVEEKSVFIKASNLEKEKPKLKLVM